MTYTWDDRNGDRRWQPGELDHDLAAGRLARDRSAIKQPYSHDLSLYLEHQINETIGARVGFVYLVEDDLFGTFIPGRSALNGAYSVAFPFTDIGVDGRAGTADDRYPDALRRAARAAGRLPVTRGDERAGTAVALQDHRVVDEQALQQPLVGADRRRPPGSRTSRSRSPTAPRRRRACRHPGSHPLGLQGLGDVCDGRGRSASRRCCGTRQA